MRNKMALIVVLMLLLSPTRACGWGADGHRIVASIATEYLTPQAKAGVTSLLDGQSLADVADWADEIRTNPAYRWASVLHYANMPPDEQEFDLQRNCPAHGCVVSAILRYSEVLGNATATKAQKTEALKFLVHFVGDVHQPLHVGYAKDKGGNDVKVELFDNRTDLHTVWDKLLIRHTKKKWTEYAAELAAKITPQQRVEWTLNDDSAAWATESHRLAATYAYQIPKDAQLGQAYFDRNIPIVNERLSTAGVRLGFLLNRVLLGERRLRTSCSAPTTRPGRTTRHRHAASAPTQPSRTPSRPAPGSEEINDFGDPYWPLRRG